MRNMVGSGTAFVLVVSASKGPQHATEEATDFALAICSHCRASARIEWHVAARDFVRSRRAMDPSQELVELCALVQLRRGGGGRHGRQIEA